MLREVTLPMVSELAGRLFVVYPEILCHKCGIRLVTIYSEPKSVHMYVYERSHKI